VEQAANDNNTTTQMIFFMAGSSIGSAPMVSDLHRAFQTEDPGSSARHEFARQAAQRIPRN
jgi:hypothetical protein